MCACYCLEEVSVSMTNPATACMMMCPSRGASMTNPATACMMMCPSRGASMTNPATACM